MKINSAKLVLAKLGKNTQLIWVGLSLAWSGFFKNDTHLAATIDNNETLKGIKKLNPNSVPGVDGVSAKMIAYIAEIKTPIITNYLNHILENGSHTAFHNLFKILKKP